MSSANQKKTILITYLIYEMKGNKFNIKDLNNYAKEIDDSVSFKNDDMPLISETVKEFNALKKIKSESEIRQMYSKMSGIDLEEDEVIELSFEPSSAATKSTPKGTRKSKLKTIAEMYPEAALTPEEKEQIKRDVKEDLELKKKDRTAWEKKHGYKPGQEKELDKYNEIYALMSVYEYKKTGSKSQYDEAVKYGLDPEKELTQEEMKKIKDQMEYEKQLDKTKESEKKERKAKKLEKENKDKVVLEDDEEEQERKKEYEETKMSDSTKTAEYSLFLYYESLYKENKSEMAKMWLLEHGYELPEEEYETIEIDVDVLYPSTTELKKFVNQLLYKSDLEKVTTRQIREQVLEHYRTLGVDLLAETEEEKERTQRLKEQYGEAEVLTKSEKLKKIVNQEIEKVWKSKEKRKDSALKRKLTKAGVEKIIDKIEDEEIEIDFDELKKKKKSEGPKKITVPKTVAKEFKEDYKLREEINDKIREVNEKIEKVDTKHQFAKLKLKEISSNPRFHASDIEEMSDKAKEQYVKLVREYDNTKDKIELYKNELEPLLDEKDKLIEQKYQLPLGALLDTMIKEKEKVLIEKEKKKVEKQDKKVSEKQKEILEEQKELGDVDKTNIYNSVYLAFLSYYLINYLTTKEDAELTVIYNEYPTLSNDFKTNFLGLSIPDRYKFMEQTFKDLSFKKISDLYENKKSIFGLGIDYSLNKFVNNQATAPTINDELELNTSYYFQNILDIANESEVVDTIYDKLLKRGVQMEDENKAREFIAVKVLEITKGISDLNQYFYNVEKYQEKNLSAFVKNQSFIKQYELDDEEEQHNIQKIYEVYKP